MEKKKFVFILTSSYDRPEVAAGAMQLAANMRAAETEVDFFLMDNAALLARKGFAESIVWQKKGQFSPISELMKTLAADLGVKFYVCEACARHHGLSPSDMVENAEVRTGFFLAEMLMERQAITF